MAGIKVSQCHSECKSMFKNGPITIDAREMPHFFSCAAEILLVLVGAQVSTVAITLHQLEYMLLHTGNGCQT